MTTVGDVRMPRCAVSHEPSIAMAASKSTTTSHRSHGMPNTSTSNDNHKPIQGGDGVELALGSTADGY